MQREKLRGRVNCFFELTDPTLARQYDQFNRANTSVLTYGLYLFVVTFGNTLEIITALLYAKSIPFKVLQLLPAVLLVLNWYKFYELRSDGGGDYASFDAFENDESENENVAVSPSSGIALYRRHHSIISDGSMNSESQQRKSTKYVNSSNSNSNSKSSFSIFTVPNAVVLLTTVYYGIRLILKQEMENCTTSVLREQVTCNAFGEVNGPDLPTLLLLFIIPIVYPVIMRQVIFRYVILSVLTAIASVVATGILAGPNAWLAHIAVLYATAMPIICYESERQSLQLFVATERLSRLVSENKRLADKTKATDMRHLIGNVAHDLKTPLTSFTSAIQFIGDVVREGMQCAAEGKLGQQEADEIFSSILECTSQVRNTNAFMEMTINRCIDYTKASTGVNLVPRLETIDLIETISLPLKIIADLPSKVSVRLKKIDPKISSHLITDKQWLQENILCLLSNAVKYSVRGVVEIHVIFHTCEAHRGLKNSVAEFSRLPAVELNAHNQEEEQQQQEQQQQQRRNKSKVTVGANARSGKLFFGRSSRVMDVPSNDTDETSLEVTPKMLKSRSIRSQQNTMHQMGTDNSASRLPATLEVFDSPFTRADATTDVATNVATNVAAAAAGATNDIESGPSAPWTATVAATASSYSKQPQFQQQLHHQLQQQQPQQRQQHTQQQQQQQQQHSPQQHTQQQQRQQQEQEQQPMIRFEVHDTGIGLSEEVMSRLFSPFSRAQRMAGGTGLGLFSLAKRVEALHGSYGVQQRHDGQQGCLFWFTIPYRPDVEDTELIGASIKMLPDHALKSFFRQGLLPSFRNSLSSVGPNRSECNSRTNSGRESIFINSSRSHVTNRSSGVGSGSGNSSSNARLSLVSSSVDENTELSQNALENGISIANNGAVVTRATADDIAASAAVVHVVNHDYPHPINSHYNTTATQRSSMNHLSILQVDDSLTILKMVGMMLRRNGHTVDNAENGAVGVDMVVAAFEAGSPYDVVLMDLQMPVMDGLEATRRIREFEAAEVAKYAAFVAAAGDDEAVADTYDTAAAAKNVAVAEENVVATAGGVGEKGDGIQSFIAFGDSESSVDSKEYDEADAAAVVKAFSVAATNSSQQQQQQQQRRSRHIAKLQPLIIIGVSANSDHFTRQEVLNIGADAFMSKPFTQQAFYESMERIRSIHAATAATSAAAAATSPL